MLEIDISSDIEEFIEDTHEFFIKDIPFTVGAALNDTAFDVRLDIIEVTFPLAFEVRNNNFARGAFRVRKEGLRGADSGLAQFKRGEIDEMVATVYDKLERGNLDKHATGGTKTPFSGGTIAIPSTKYKDQIRTKTGRVSQRNKPRNITNQKGYFLGKSKRGGRKFIAKRTSTGIETVFSFKEQAQLKKEFRFYEDAETLGLRYFPRNWRDQFSKVVSRSKWFTET